MVPKIVSQVKKLQNPSKHISAAKRSGCIFPSKSIELAEIYNMTELKFNYHINFMIKTPYSNQEHPVPSIAQDLLDHFFSIKTNIVSQKLEKFSSKVLIIMTRQMSTFG